VAVARDEADERGRCTGEAGAVVAMGEGATILAATPSSEGLRSGACTFDTTREAPSDLTGVPRRPREVDSSRDGRFGTLR